jgi:hypothetical protein
MSVHRAKIISVRFVFSVEGSLTITAQMGHYDRGRTQIAAETSADANALCFDIVCKAPSAAKVICSLKISCSSVAIFRAPLVFPVGLPLCPGLNWVRRGGRL